MIRFGQIIGIRPEQFERYKSYHAAVWPVVMATIKDCNIQNYSIFQKNGFLFAYFEYTGDDFKADMLKMSNNKKKQEWWEIVKPMQQPVANSLKNEWWSNMEEIFHLD